MAAEGATMDPVSFFRKIFLQSAWASNWSRAIRERDYANIADWFSFRFFLIGGLCVILSGVAAYIEKGRALGVRVLAMSLLMASACTVSGWLLGLLFGIPRSLARPSSTVAPSAQDNAAGADVSKRNATSRANTNLEDISDWLTKTIVGVGLTQLYTIPKFLGDLARDADQYGFHWQSAGHLLTLLIVFYFAPGGFWLGYVGTRTMLAQLFDATDKSLNADEVQKAASPKNLQASEQGIRPPDASLAAIDQVLLRLPLQSLNSLPEIVAWAAAKARSGDLETAKVVLENTLRDNPSNKDIKQQLATVYTALGKHSDAAKLLTDSSPTPTAVLNALYEDAPGGFLKAIAIGEELKKDAAFRSDPNMHVWLACAYAQMYGYLQRTQRPQVERDAAKEGVLSESRAAITLLPAAKGWLHAYWKPPEGSIDNDLAVFPPDDKELTELLEK